MTAMRRRTAILCLGVALCFAAFSGALAAERSIVIGTGPVAGVYFPAGGALCNRINAARARHGLRCFAESTRGSKDNLDRLRRGEIDFALVQSDWQYLAIENGHGEGEAPFEDLRAVLALHAQAVTLMVGPESGVAAVEDLKGRRVNLGPKGSAVRAIGESLIGALGWRRSDFAEISEFGIEAQATALCDGRIDAALLPVSHPSGAVAAATQGCSAKLVPLAGRAVEKLIETWPFYARAKIPGGLYRANPDAITTYGTRATLVTTEAVPEEVVYEVARAVFEGLDELRRAHPALSGLDEQAMINSALSAPLHAGAARYYRESGRK